MHRKGCLNVNPSTNDREPTPNASEKPVCWKRNLAFIWAAQFVSIMSFSFGLPFAPYFIQSLGVEDNAELNMWVALFGASTPLTFAIFSPMWGALADRVGRRPMLLRAYLGGGVVLSLMGLVTSPSWLIALRLAQGALTGTVTASQVLVTAHTPSHRSGIALGSLNSAVFSGALTGAFIGGWTAELLGYRVAFICSGAFMLISATLVLFGVREFFSPPKPPASGVRKSLIAGMRPSKEELKMALPILTLMMAVMFVRQFDSSFVPLLVQKIHGGIEGAAFKTGTLFALCGLAGVLSGISLGWLADRTSPARIGKWSALFAGLMLFPQAFAGSLGMLYAARFGMVFAGGGLDPVLQIWLAKMTPEKSRGLIFGWSASARSFGWFFAPLAGGLVANMLGLEYIFICGGFLYLSLIYLIARTVRKLKPPESEPSDEEIERQTIVFRQ